MVDQRDVLGRVLLLGVLGVVFLSMIGCASYTNIPPQAGDHLAQHSPNRAVVQDVMTEALHAVLDQRPIRGTFQVILPETADAVTYATLLPRLGDDAMWSSDGRRQDVPVLEVRQIRIRAMSAAVDIVRPAAAVPNIPGLSSATPLRSQELVTVQLRRYLGGGWGVTRVYAWNADVEQALQLSLASEPSDAPIQGATPIEPEPR